MPSGVPLRCPDFIPRHEEWSFKTVLCSLDLNQAFSARFFEGQDVVALVVSFDEGRVLYFCSECLMPGMNKPRPLEVQRKGFAREPERAISSLALDIVHRQPHERQL